MWVKFRAGMWLKNPEPHLEKLWLRATAHLSIDLSNRGLDRDAAGVSVNGPEAYGSSHSMFGRGTWQCAGIL